MTTENIIILKIGKVHTDSVQPWNSQFTISIQNSVDNTNTFPNNNSEDIKTYKETEELEVILEGIRTYLLTRSPHEHIGVDMIVEDSG